MIRLLYVRSGRSGTLIDRSPERTRPARPSKISLAVSDVPHGSGQQRTTPARLTTNEEEAWGMIDDTEFRRLLRQAVHLPDDASDYAILAAVETGYHFYLLNRPVPGDPPPHEKGT